MIKIISIDWLQLYVDITNLHQHKDYEWRLQNYQTKQFRQVFVVSYKKEELCTLVCQPTSSILPQCAGIVKFSNRQLYGQCLEFIVSSFLTDNGLVYKSITRVDLACDFNTFNRGLEVPRFIKSFMNSSVLKVGRGKYTLIGEQKFCHTIDYLRFGTKTSEVNTYLYNKTKELLQVHDKPYIRKLWDSSGLASCVDVWRCEISIKSKGCNYVNISTGEQDKINITQLFDYQYICDIFNSYANQYFKFVINNGLTNKSRMKQLNLFGKSELIYKPLYLPETTGAARADRIFLKKLHQFDQEFRGSTEFGRDAQKQLLTEFIELAGLSDFYEAKATQWNKTTFRPS